MEEITKPYRSSKKGGIIFGIILIALGTLLLLFNLGIINTALKRVIFSWQMLLVVFGIVSFLYRHFWFGTLLLITGIFFIAPEFVAACPDTFGWLGADFSNTYLPALLIITGILIIIKLFFSKSKTNNSYRIYYDSRYRRHRKHNCKCGENCNCNNAFVVNTVFGSSEEIILDNEFNGGVINSVFGSTTLDLRKTAIPEGDTDMEINCVFGSVTLYIPDNWNVALRMDKFASGLEDNRKKITDVDYSRRLIIVGSVVFGSGEILS